MSPPHPAPFDRADAHPATRRHSFRRSSPDHPVIESNPQEREGFGKVRASCFELVHPIFNEHLRKSAQLAPLLDVPDVLTSTSSHLDCPRHATADPLSLPAPQRIPFFDRQSRRNGRPMSAIPAHPNSFCSATPFIRRRCGPIRAFRQGRQNHRRVHESIAPAPGRAAISPLPLMPALLARLCDQPVPDLAGALRSWKASPSCCWSQASAHSGYGT